MTDVVNRERLEERVRIQITPGERAQLVVVVGAAADRFFEDRRVRGHSAKPGVDEASQFAGGEHAATDVVEPDALSGGGELFELIGHEKFP